MFHSNFVTCLYTFFIRILRSLSSLHFLPGAITPLRRLGPPTSYPGSFTPLHGPRSSLQRGPWSEDKRPLIGLSVPPHPFSTFRKKKPFHPALQHIETNVAPSWHQQKSARFGGSWRPVNTWNSCRDCHLMDVNVWYSNFTYISSNKGTYQSIYDCSLFHIYQKTKIAPNFKWYETYKITWTIAWTKLFPQLFWGDFPQIF